MLVIANELSHFGDKAIEDVAPAVVHGDDEAGSSQKSEPQKSKTKKKHVNCKGSKCECVLISLLPFMMIHTNA